MATFSDAHTKQLQKLLTCAICSDYYQDPRLLPCSHTFCFQCIEKSIKNGGFNCPLEDDVKIAQNDIVQLPFNRTAKDMVEFVGSINLSTDRKLSHQCENCDQEATIWCEQCVSHFCEKCTEEIHSMKRFQSHMIVPLVEKVQSFCQYHPEEKFTYWCKKCEILVCRDCLLFQHKFHTFSALKDAAAEAKAKFYETIQEIDEIKRSLTTCLKTTKSVINQQREGIRQEKQDIEQIFANLQHRLEERKLAIIKQVEENDLQTTSILNRQRVTINQHLNLTMVQELCVRKMLDSHDPLPILKFKSALYRNYNRFVEQYNRIDDGYIVKIHLLKKYDKDIEQILQIISKIGHSDSTSWMIKGDSVTIKISSIDISIVGGETEFITKESNYARGYKFTLKKSLKLRSIQIHSDQVGQITGFVVNDAGIIIQKGTLNSSNATMKWLRIPIECDIQNNYTVLVLTPPDNGSYTYKNGDNQPRIINQNCSVESKCVQAVTQINVGSKMTVENNTSSINMILDVEGMRMMTEVINKHIIFNFLFFVLRVYVFV